MISFIKIFLLCAFSSLPVLYYTYLFPELLTGQHISYKAINYFLLGYLAPDYIIYAFIIGILFEYFEIFLSKMIKYVDGDVIKDTIINSIGLFLGYMTYLLFPNNIDLYSYIELLNNSIQN